jgi:RNase adapter protein RapZ
MSKISLIIITGLSGAGKSTALNYFEDTGYYTVDNLPSFLLKDFLSGMKARKKAYSGLALVMDARDEEFISDENFSILNKELKDFFSITILFLEAEKEVLRRRYSQMRRPHFLAADGAVNEGIKQEIKKLAFLRKQANIVIDTTALNLHQLRANLKNKFGSISSTKLAVEIISFGYKRGIPDNVELLFDVRFLPNPYFKEKLRVKTGLDPAVSAYVFDKKISRKFVKHLKSFIDFLLPEYIREGKANLTIGIGCTGGKHRSVAVTEELARNLNHPDCKPNINHRDINKE